MYKMGDSLIVSAQNNTTEWNILMNMKVESFQAQSDATQDSTNMNFQSQAKPQSFTPQLHGGNE